jgi:hypothetical protein
MQLPRIKAVIAISMCVLPSYAYAETFAERVRLAKAAETAEAYKSYQPVFLRGISDPMAQIMRACFAKTEKPHADSFVLVADITREGKAQATEVKPTTNIATCFAAGMSKVSFPQPPVYSGRQGFPIAIEMKISP